MDERKSASPAPAKKKWGKWAAIGLVVLILFLTALLFVPQQVSGWFDAMAQKALNTVVKNWIVGATGVATIIAVMTGRIFAGVR